MAGVGAAYWPFHLRTHHRSHGTPGGLHSMGPLVALLTWPSLRVSPGWFDVGWAVMIRDTYRSLPDLFPTTPDQTVDPGSILRDQNKGLIRQPELGCKHQMLASVHHHIQYLICIYTSDQHWEVTPVWKSTKISVSGLFFR